MSETETLVINTETKNKTFKFQSRDFSRPRLKSRKLQACYLLSPPTTIGGGKILKVGGQNGGPPFPPSSPCHPSLPLSPPSPLPIPIPSLSPPYLSRPSQVPLHSLSSNTPENQLWGWGCCKLPQWGLGHNSSRNRIDVQNAAEYFQ